MTHLEATAMYEQLYSTIDINEKEKKIIIEFSGFDTTQECEEFVRDLAQFFSFSSINHHVKNQTIH